MTDAPLIRTGLLLLCLSVWGCGGGTDPNLANRPAVVPAEGVVNFKGAPLEGATVIFSPTAGGANGASASTDADGKFVLSAFPPDTGAVPGSYQVAITKMSIADTAASPASHDAEGPVATPKPLIPERYSNPASSGLTAEIPASGKQDLKFDLTE